VDDVNSVSARLLRSTILTGLSDGLFSSVLVVFFYGSTATRLFQYVASTLLGQSAFDGGMPVALFGLLIHFSVAFGWSAVFLLILSRAGWVRALLYSRFGVIKVAAIYGPCVWLMMSLVIIPLITHHGLPALTYRWWIQLVGHFPFVGIPIVWSIGKETVSS